MPKKDRISEYLAEIGRRGGKKEVPKGIAMLTPEERSERAKKAAAARWSSQKKKAAAKRKESK